jgi:hypothetical protein
MFPAARPGFLGLLGLLGMVGLFALTGFGAAAQAASSSSSSTPAADTPSASAPAITLGATPCSSPIQFTCPTITGDGGQKISLQTTHGGATSSSGKQFTYAAKMTVTVDGVAYSGTATAEGGALAGHVVSYRYTARNMARSDRKPGLLDINQLTLSITGVSCGRGKVCFTGSGVHTDLNAGSLTVH